MILSVQRNKLVFTWFTCIRCQLTWDDCLGGYMNGLKVHCLICRIDGLSNNAPSVAAPAWTGHMHWFWWFLEVGLESTQVYSGLRSSTIFSYLYWICIVNYTISAKCCWDHRMNYSCCFYTCFQHEVSILDALLACLKTSKANRFYFLIYTTVSLNSSSLSCKRPFYCSLLPTRFFLCTICFLR